MRFVHSSNAQIDGEMRWKYISVLGWKVCWPLIGCKQQQIDCSRRIKATECQLFGPNDTVYDFIIYLRDWFWHLLSCPWTLPFVRFVMVVGWRDFLFLLHRSDNFHRLRTLNHCTTALSVYLGSPVSAIFFEYRAHRWGYYLRKKMWQHNFTGRAHIHLYDDDDDTIFFGNNCSLVKSLCRGWCFIVALLFRSVGWLMSMRLFWTALPLITTSTWRVGIPTSFSTANRIPSQ